MIRFCKNSYAWKIVQHLTGHFFTCAPRSSEVTGSFQIGKLCEMNHYGFSIQFFHLAIQSTVFSHISCRKVWISWLKDQSTIVMLNCWGRTVLEGCQMLNFNLKYDWLRNMMKLNKLWLARASTSTVCRWECTYCIGFISVLVMDSNALCQ